MNIKLLSVIQKSIPNFDATNKEDIIKAEKFLKLEAKLNNEFTPNDVDEIIEFFKNNGSKFDAILANEAVICILNEDTVSFSKLNFTSDRLKLFEDQSNRLHYSDNEKLLETQNILCEDFADIFSEPIWQFIQTNILEENWLNIIKVFEFYHSLISYTNFEKLTTILTQKNKVIFELIPYKKKYKLLKGQYAYGVNETYFRMLSVIDAYYFEEQVNRINSNVVSYQNISKYYKVYLGEILIAISNFDAVSEEIIRVLADNKKIAFSWINYNERFDSSIVASLLNLKSKKYSVNIEWLILFVYFISLIFIYFMIYKEFNNFIFGIFVVEIIVYLVYREQLDIDNTIEESLEKKDKVLLLFKNVAIQTFIVQILSVLWSLIVAIFAIVGIFSKGIGIFLFFWIYNNSKKK